MAIKIRDFHIKNFQVVFDPRIFKTSAPAASPDPEKEYFRFEEEKVYLNMLDQAIYQNIIEVLFYD